MNAGKFWIFNNAYRFALIQGPVIQNFIQIAWLGTLKKTNSREKNALDWFFKGFLTGSNTLPPIETGSSSWKFTRFNNQYLLDFLYFQ